MKNNSNHKKIVGKERGCIIYPTFNGESYSSENIDVLTYNAVYENHIKHVNKIKKKYCI